MTAHRVPKRPLAAVSFLTPFGGAVAPVPGALGWFPMVGLGLGAVLGALWWGTAKAWPPLVVAGLVLAADLALTGLLHFDGVVDSADGLLPPMAKERRLEVMAEPGAGAFGVVVAAALLVLRFAALASLAPSVLLLAGLWCVSRTVMAFGALALPYARSEGGGLASAFLGTAPGQAHTTGWPASKFPLAVTLGILAGLLLSVLAVMAWRPVAGLVSLGCGLLGAGAVLALAVRRVGGFTGDVLGAAGMVCETVALTVAAARW